MLKNIPKKFSPYHVTEDDASTPPHRLEMEQITGHQSVKGQGGIIAVPCKTHWAGLPDSSWEREMNFHLSRPPILRYWTGTPDQHPRTNCLYRLMRIGPTQRELSRNNGEHPST